MEQFLARHEGNIRGVLHGLDRVLFRGTLRSMAYLAGMNKFLEVHGVLYKEFSKFVEGVSQRIKDRARQLAEQHHRPFKYLKSSAISKEDVAQEIAQRDKIKQGLVCVLSCVEPCQSFALHRNAEKKWLELVPATRKCLFLYFYFMDREFGLMHVRLQTWLPMPIQVCLNGREYLAQRLDRAGIGYEKRDNCFTQIDDLPRAQRMLQSLEQRDWVRFLNALAKRVNPWLAAQSGLDLHPYYWTIRQSEYATDVMFSDANALQKIYPALVNHAMQHFRCHDVMRFLGRRTNVRFNGRCDTNVRSRAEGVRIKHWVEENSIKMYDKQGSVLRIETTIDNPRRFRVRRAVTRKGQRQSAWIPMRKSVADLTRRVEICRAANERYLEALGVGGAPAPTRHLLDPISRRVTCNGRRYRALRPIDPEEARLFTTLLDGTFLLQGFRNRDIRRQTTAHSDSSVAERKRASTRITRLLRLLRAHGLISKVSGTFYYRVTAKGNHVMTTALRLRELDLHELAA